MPLPEELSDVIYNVQPTPAETSNNSSALVGYANDAQLLSDYVEQQSQHLELTDCNIELMDQYQLTDQIDLCSDDIELPLVSEPFNILAPPPIFTKATPPASNQLLPPIELPTIAVVKKAPMKASEIVAEVKTRKQLPLPAKRTLIVNDSTLACEAEVGKEVGVAVAPALSYEAWLDYVIELINDSIEPDAATPPAAVSSRLVQHRLHAHKVSKCIK